MIYLDTSVALAHFLGENRAPPVTLWDEPLISSRLLEYEMWNRVHARGLSKTHADGLRELLARVTFLELSFLVLARALEAFPIPVKTLDALHLASIEYLRTQGRDISLATYDERMMTCAKAMKFKLVEL
jgi:predicted nucleic acid-binding protein